MGKHLVGGGNVRGWSIAARWRGTRPAAHARMSGWRGGRRAFGEGRPAGHRRHGRAEHRAGLAALAPSREGKGRARAHDHSPRPLAGSSTAAQRGHFAQVLEAAVDLPSVIYNSPYYGFQTRAELFFELRKAGSHIWLASRSSAARSRCLTPPNISPVSSDDIALTVGVDTEVVPRIRAAIPAPPAPSPASRGPTREVLRLVEL